MLQIYNGLLLLLLLYTYTSSSIAKPAAPQYSNVTLQLARGIQMAAYMNVDVNPCDDFYNWACGHWSFNHPATLAKRKTSYIELLEDLYVSKCVAALQEPTDNAAATDKYLDNLLRAVYESCHDTKAINIIGYAPIWDALELHAAWPLITDHDWFETEYDWLKFVVLAKRKFNVDVLIGFDVVKDLEHVEAYRIQLGAPQLALNKHVDYRSYVETKLQQFFPEMSNSWCQEIASQVVQVEEKLAKAMPNVSSDLIPLDRYVAELKVSYGSFIDLSRYLQLMFDRPINDKVYETPKGYFRNLVDIIRLTPKLTLANYTLWKVLDRFDLGGSKEFCARKLMNYFPHELEYYFYRNFEDTTLVQELQTTFHNLKFKLSEELQTSSRFNWIAPQTLHSLREKLRSMRVEVLQPQEQIGFFQGGIKPHDMKSDQYYSNIINTLEWQNEKELLKLHQAAALLNTPQITIRYEQQLLPAYNSQTNTIQFPVIFLQSRFLWDPSYPVAIKHGTYTFLLAQQIVRGLSEDDNVSDERKVWDVTSELAFVKRSSCYAQQSHYAAKEYLDKNVTDRERVKKALMDNGGLSIAYRIFGKNTKHAIESSVLPKLPVTHSQQFFLAYAQLFCADHAEQEAIYSDLPEALRVNGAVANLAEFAIEFKCNDDRKLNPKTKCVIF